MFFKNKIINEIKMGDKGKHYFSIATLILILIFSKLNGSNF